MLFFSLATSRVHFLCGGYFSCFFLVVVMVTNQHNNSPSAVFTCLFSRRHVHHKRPTIHDDVCNCEGLACVFSGVFSVTL